MAANNHDAFLHVVRRCGNVHAVGVEFLDDLGVVNQRSKRIGVFIVEHGGRLPYRAHARLHSKRQHVWRESLPRAHPPWLAGQMPQHCHWVVERNRQLSVWRHAMFAIQRIVVQANEC